jgi:hypothetical protein
MEHDAPWLTYSLQKEVLFCTEFLAYSKDPDCKKLISGMTDWKYILNRNDANAFLPASENYVMDQHFRIDFCLSETRTLNQRIEPKMTFEKRKYTAISYK